MHELLTNKRARIYAPGDGALAFNIMDAQGKAAGHPSVYDCERLTPKTHRLRNVWGQFRAVHPVDHDTRAPDLVFMDGHAYRYKRQPGQLGYAFTEKGEEVRNISIASALGYYLRNRPYLDALQESTAVELFNFMRNESALHARQVLAIRELAQAVEDETYSGEKAARLIRPVLMTAAGIYCRAYCERGARIGAVFSRPTIDHAALAWARYFEEEYPEIIPRG